MTPEPSSVSKQIDRLTRRERQVLLLRCEGLNYIAIAEASQISVATVRVHMARIYQKLGLDTLTFIERQKQLFEVYGPELRAASDFPKNVDLPAQEGEQVPPGIFLCHASQDKSHVRRLYGALKQAGADVWFDEARILPGQEWELEIEKAIRRADYFLACLSTKSIDKKGYVQKELRLGLEILELTPPGEIYLIPVRLEECEVPLRLASRQWVDLFQPDGFQKLLEALKLDSKAK